MTRFYQPLDLMVNGSPKRFIAEKSNSWYLQQISNELESGKPLEEIDIKNCIFRSWNHGMQPG